MLDTGCPIWHDGLRNWLYHIVYCLCLFCLISQPVTYCLLPVAYWLLPTAHCAFLEPRFKIKLILVSSFSGFCDKCKSCNDPKNIFSNQSNKKNEKFYHIPKSKPSNHSNKH